METLFFTIVILFFLGIAVYYVFQRSKQGSLLPKKKREPEIISPEPQVYAGSDSAPTLEQALEEVENEPAEEALLPDEQIAEERLIDNQDLIGNQDGRLDEESDTGLNEEADESLDEEREAGEEL